MKLRIKLRKKQYANITSIKQKKKMIFFFLRFGVYQIHNVKFNSYYYFFFPSPECSSSRQKQKVKRTSRYSNSPRFVALTIMTDFHTATHSELSNWLPEHLFFFLDENHAEFAGLTESYDQHKLFANDR